MQDGPSHGIRSPKWRFWKMWSFCDFLGGRKRCLFLKVHWQGRPQKTKKRWRSERCSDIVFYSPTSANHIFHMKASTRNPGKHRKKYQGIWGSCGAFSHLASMFRKFVAGEGLSRNLAWTCFVASWNTFRWWALNVHPRRLTAGTWNWWALEEDFPHPLLVHSQVPAVNLLGCRGCSFLIGINCD